MTSEKYLVRNLEELTQGKEFYLGKIALIKTASINKKMLIKYLTIFQINLLYKAWIKMLPMDT